ncbi:hypothetical protein JCM12178A_07820 [Salidesulfovibrio brasiliensis]
MKIEPYNANVCLMIDLIKKKIHYISTVYARAYSLLAGSPPKLFPWHYQWHATRELDRDLSSILSEMEGAVLDFGCGQQPYRSFFKANISYTGADIVASSDEIVSIAPDAPLPFSDESFDAIVCTQVLEHVAAPETRIAELSRVLKPGGVMCLSVPFIFHVHGKPHDYRRLSEYGARELVKGFNVEKVYRQGGVGSSLAVLSLGWIDHQAEMHAVTYLLKILLTPLWIPFCFIINCMGMLFDYMDTTEAFYSNVLMVVRKK